MTLGGAGLLAAAVWTASTADGSTAMVHGVTRGVASAAIATVNGTQVFGDAYLVVDGATTYSVLDVYVKSDNPSDNFSSVYGVASYKASWTQVQGRDFKHAAGTSWEPSSPDAPTWDSFVTTGMRVQTVDEEGSTPIALSADPGFSNLTSTSPTSNNRLRGPTSGNGPGWFPAIGANPGVNPFCRFSHYNGQSGPINTAKATRTIVGNGITPGQSLNNHFMIGRFSVDVTGTAPGTELSMQLKFAMTVFSDGAIKGGATDPLFRVDQALRFAVPELPPPPAPTGVAATDGTSTGQVTLSWAASAGATSYRVFRGVGSASTEIGTSVATSFADTTAVPGTVYTYAVRAVNASGDSAASTTDTGYRRVLPPTAVAATDGTVNGGVNLSWSAATGVSSYRVLRSDGGAPVQIATVAATSHLDTTGTSCVSYTYSVVSAGPGGTLDSDASTADAGSRPLDTPGSLTASDGVAGAVTLAWTAVPDAASYAVFRGIGSASTEIGTSVTNGFTDATAEPGRLYTYAVRAAAACQSLISNADTGWRALAAPASLTAADGESTAHVRLTWAASPGASGYEIRRGIGSASAVLASVAAITSFDDASAVPGVLYTYAVRATGDPGTGASDPSPSNTGWRGLLAPASLTAGTGQSATQVDLAWPAVTGAQTYEIHRSTGGPLALLATTASTSFADTTAVVGTVYSYAVRAVGGAGTGPGPFTATVNGSLAAGPAPTSVAASDGDSTLQITLTWSYGDGATGFRILRATGGGAFAQLTLTDGAARSFADITAEPGTLYRYQIRAVLGGSGDSLANDPEQGWRGLLPPDGVLASDGESVDHVAVTWGTVTGAREYRVFRTLEGGTPTQIGTTPAPQQTYLDTSALPGITYVYSVRAMGEAGTGMSAFSLSNDGLRGIAAPTGVQATDGTASDSVTITWTASAGASRYRVYRAVGSGAPTPLGIVSGTQFVDTSSTPGVLGQYTVRAMAASGLYESAASAADSGWRALAPPATLSASDGSSTAHVFLSWGASTGATGYKVFRALGSAAAELVGTTLATPRNFSDSSAIPGRIYTYTVRAVGQSGTGDSPASPSDTGWRGLTAPTGVLASDGTSTAHVAVSWSGSEGATKYKVFRAVGLGTPSLIGETADSSLSYLDTTAEAGRIHRYTVRASGQTGTGDSAASVADQGWRQLAAPTQLTTGQGLEGSTEVVQISWLPVSGLVTGYRLLRGPSPSELVQVGGELLAPSVTSFQDTPSPGRLFHYAVEAVGETGTGAGSRSIVVTGWRRPNPAEPTAPMPPLVEGARITWPAVEGASAYRVLRVLGAIREELVRTQDTGFTDTTATAGKLLRYVVIAEGEPGTGDARDSRLVTAQRRLRAPTSVMATDGTSTTGVTLSWQAVPDAKRYKVLRSMGGGQPRVLGTVLTTGFDDTSVLAGRLASYTVVATGDNGTVDGLPGGDDGWAKLRPPTSVRASDGTSAQHVEVTWNAPPAGSAHSYEVYRTFGSTTTRVATVVQSLYRDASAVAGRTYAYSVRALGDPGTGPSDISVADNGFRSLIAVPGDVTASRNRSDGVLVSWSAVPNATGYVVYRGLTSRNLVRFRELSSPEVLDTTTPVNVTYWYAVSAKLGAQESAKSTVTGGRRVASSARSGVDSAGGQHEGRADGKDRIPGDRFAAFGVDGVGGTATEGVRLVGLPEIDAYLLLAAHAEAPVVSCSDEPLDDPSEAETLPHAGAPQDASPPESSGPETAWIDVEATDAAEPPLADRGTPERPDRARSDAVSELPPIDMDGNGVPDLCQLLQGDLNLDGRVDAADLSMLILLMGTEPVQAIGDLHPDGMIDALDFAVLADMVQAASGTPPKGSEQAVEPSPAQGGQGQLEQPDNSNIPAGLD